MIKVLIVDDEPLVQVGIKSMLNWQELNMEICGTAVNGQAALKIIEEQSPDIVITDIKMPVMSGLELIRYCRETYGNTRPSFIILTSFEDFHMVKEALTYQVSDYLVKLELTPESLREAVTKVADRLPQPTREEQNSPLNVRPFYDKFFISLLHNLFESEEQFRLQSKDLNLEFDYAGYLSCYGEICCPQADQLPMDKQLSLFNASLQMLRELVIKYHQCFCLSLDIRHFALIFCYEQAECSVDTSVIYKEIQDILESISSTLQKYYNVTLRCGIGNLVDNTYSISDSYQTSRQLFRQTDESVFLACYTEKLDTDSSQRSFNISLFKKDLTKAFEEFDDRILRDTVRDIIELFDGHPNHYVQALDACSNILYLSISLLPGGETTVAEMFQDDPEAYRSLYRQSTTEQVMNWLRYFTDQMCELFATRRKDYKNRIVANVKKYVQEHIRERLSLNEVSALFGISPSYLSQLFSKYNETGFVEYVNGCKIAEAKKLLDEGNLKVYEVADLLGFESAFYFSKVYKKIEGVSPTGK